MKEEKPSLDLKKKMAKEALAAAKEYHNGKYKGTDEKLIDVIESGIQRLQKKFSNEYPRTVIRSLFPVLVLKISDSLQKLREGGD